MPKASEVATELRKLADVLDMHAETRVIKPIFHLGPCTKEQMKTAISVLPRPIAKVYPQKEGPYEQIFARHDTSALEIEAWGWRGDLCTIKTPARPAEYECEPLLSDDEFDEAAK